MTDAHDSPDALTVAQAAALLGMTEDGIRRRIKRRQLVAWQVRGKRGAEWRVRLTPDTTADATSRDINATTATPAAPLMRVGDDRHTELLDRLDRLTAAVEALTAAMADRHDGATMALDRATMAQDGPDTSDEYAEPTGGWRWLRDRILPG